MIAESNSSNPSQDSTIFKVLTSRSLKCILTEPADRIEPLPNEDFMSGNQLSRKYYGEFDPKNMACVPLDEIDPAYKKLKTFVVIGKHGTIHRYSARNALEALSPLNPVRRWAIFITTHWAFAMFMSAVVILNTVLIVNNAGRVYDHTATVIYAIEFLLKIMSEGLIRDPFTYLRKPLNWLDIVVISTSLIRPFKSISLLTWARLLKLIQLTPEIRRWCRFLAAAIGRLCSVLLYSLFLIFLFSLIGKLSFLGMFTKRCVSYSDYWEQLSISSISNDTTVVSWRDFAQNKENWYSDASCLEENNKMNLLQCPEDLDFECVSGVGANPDYGFTTFDDTKFSILQTIRVIDQDCLEKILNQLTLSSASPTYIILYFIVLFFFGTYALGTFAYAILGKHIFDFLQKKCKNSSDLLDETTVQDDSFSTQQSSRPSNKDHVLLFVHSVLNSSVFEVVIVSTILLDIVALSLQQHDMTHFSNLFSKWMIRLATIMYTFEFVFKIYVDGARKYVAKGWNLFDVVVLVDMYFQLLYKKYVMSFPFRIFKLTPRWNTLQLFFKIVIDSIKILWGLCALLVTLGAYIALVGMSEFRQNYLDKKYLFEGGFLPRWSFIDFPHSAMIVFRSWIGESIEVLGECLLVQENGCIIYFATVSFVGIFILMALTVGVVFVTDKTLKSAKPRKISILATMFCYPYVWLKMHKELDAISDPPGPSIYNPNNTCAKKKKIISCSPTPGGSHVLRGVSTFIIIVFSLALVLDDIEYENNIDVESLIYAVDVVFTIFISIMAGYSLIVLGAKYCVTSPGWIFDVFVVLEMIINLLYDLKPDLNPYPTFYLFRSLRPFMLVSRIEVLEIVFRGILKELRFLWKFMVVGAFIWLYFAIHGTKMFSGTFSKCLNDEDGSFINSTLVLNRKQCIAMNHTWENSELNFDHIGKSFISLALVGKRNAWVSILYDSTDFHAPQMNFRREHDLNSFYFFLAFFVCGIFLVASVIFGVIYYSLNQFTGIFLTKEQMKTPEKFDKSKLKIPSDSLYTKPDGKYRIALYNFVSTEYFDAGILFMILLDLSCFACIDAETEYWSQEDFSITRQIRMCILFVYILELMLKFIGWGKRYFYNGWNQFDCLIVFSSVTEMLLLKFGFSSWMIIDLIRILRVLRIFQFKPFTRRAKTLFRYFSAWPNFSVAFRNIVIFYCLIMYSYALLGVRRFGHVKLNKGLDEYFSFRTVGSSLRVLFMLSSMAGVDGILPAITEENECTPDRIGTIFYQGDCGSMFWGTVFVFSYSFFSFLSFTNLYMLFIFEIIKQFKQNVEPMSHPENATSSDNSVFHSVAPPTAYRATQTVGTCRMGKGENDPKAVVDFNLRVLRIFGLRVADASIMPQIPS